MRGVPGSIPGWALFERHAGYLLPVGVVLQGVNVLLCIERPAIGCSFIDIINMLRYNDVSLGYYAVLANSTKPNKMHKKALDPRKC